MKNKKTKESKIDYPDEWMSRFFDWDKGLPGKKVQQNKTETPKIPVTKKVQEKI